MARFAPVERRVDPLEDLMAALTLNVNAMTLLNTDELRLRWFWNSLKIEDGDLIAVEGWSGW